MTRLPCTVEGCEAPRVSFGLCNRHRQRVRKGQDVGPAGPLHDPMYRFCQSFQYDRATDCWYWLKWKDCRGYGRFTFENATWLAHRWMYERLFGPIPHGLTLDHLCRNPSCVNPHHMEPVTRSENTRRAWLHRRVAS